MKRTFSQRNTTKVVHMLSTNTDPPEDLTIVLIGKTGAGKSASGNTILGLQTFESKLSLSPLTNTISERTGDVFGKRVRVVDTPGILNSNDTEEIIRTYCVGLLQSRRRCLFLVTVRVGRFTKEDEEAVKAAQRAIGPQGGKSTYLLFTGGDDLNTLSLDDFISEDQEGTLRDVVQMFRGANHLFNNEHEDEDQVFQLLVKAGLFSADSPDILSGDSKDRRIVLLGLPGAGKSSLGNTILRSKKFKSGCDFNSVPQTCQKESAVVDGRNITVVDTPGITDEFLNPQYLNQQIRKACVEASPGPHAFVIVVKLGTIGKSESELLKLLCRIFGSDAAKYSMVLFTHGDELGDRNIGDLITSNSCVSELVSTFGDQYCVLENKAKQTRGQVSEFLTKIDGMVTANGGQHFTNSMLEMMETFQREHILKKKQDEIEKLLQRNDRILNRELRTMRRTIRTLSKLERKIFNALFEFELHQLIRLLKPDESGVDDELDLDDESDLDD